MNTIGVKRGIKGRFCHYVIGNAYENKKFDTRICVINELLLSCQLSMWDFIFNINREQFLGAKYLLKLSNCLLDNISVVPNLFYTSLYSNGHNFGDVVDYYIDTNKIQTHQDML